MAVDECDPPRYRLLETMRKDASRRLVAAGEEPQARARFWVPWPRSAFTAWRLEAMQWLESCEALAEGRR